MRGEPFGRYRLLRRLAFGGMAEIFLASLHRDEGFEKRVVLKRILPQFCADPSFVQMFIDEAVVAARIAHPNVVQVYDFGNVDGTYFIAMEWVDGVDLRRVLAKNDVRLSTAEVAAIGEGVARGLSYAHNLTDDHGAPLHIIHRDVSPHNIMISRAGEAKLMDFGIAKAAARVSKTATGAIKGKVGYMSPEQGAGRTLDKRTDQFALGVVLWECLSGQRLFTGESDLEILRKVVSCEVRDVRELAPATPALLADATMRCLAPDPANRFGDLAEVAAALAEFRFSLGTEGAVHLGSLADQVAPAVHESDGNGRTRDLGADSQTQEGSTRDDGASDWSTGSSSPATAVAAESGPPRLATQSMVTITPSSSYPPVASPPRRRRWPWMIFAAGVLAAIGAGIAAWARFGSPSSDGEIATTQVEVSSTPRGARISIDGRETGLATPASLPGQIRGQPVRITVMLDGYEVWESRVTPSAAVEKVSATLLRVALPSGGAKPPEIPGSDAYPSPPPVSQVQPSPPGEASATSRSPPPRRVDASALAAEKKRRPHNTKKRRNSRRRETPVPTGRLSLRSNPLWAYVYLEGRRIGNTPLNEVEVPAGNLRLRLVNPEKGIEREIVVRVEPNASVRHTVALE